MESTRAKVRRVLRNYGSGDIVSRTFRDGRLNYDVTLGRDRISTRNSGASVGAGRRG